MKYFLFIILIITSCKQEGKIHLKEDFVFSYDNGISFKSFSFKNDTVFMARNYPEHSHVYYYVLNENDKKRINVFLDTLEDQDFKKEYIQESIIDAGTYQFQFLDRNKLIYVYGFRGEYEIDELKKLNRFSSFLSELEMSKMIRYNDTTHYGIEKIYWNKDVDFGDLERFIIPDMPYDTIH